MITTAVLFGASGKRETIHVFRIKCGLEPWIAGNLEESRMDFKELEAALPGYMVAENGSLCLIAELQSEGADAPAMEVIPGRIRRILSRCNLTLEEEKKSEEWLFNDGRKM